MTKDVIVCCTMRIKLILSIVPGSRQVWLRGPKTGKLAKHFEIRPHKHEPEEAEKKQVAKKNGWRNAHKILK